MTFDDALAVIKKTPGIPIRRASWDDRQAIVWWSSRGIEYFSLRTGSIEWTPPEEDARADDWVVIAP